MESLTNWFYKQTHHISKGGMILTKDDKCAYKSKSRNTIFNDGIITSCSKFGVYISYGFGENFGFWNAMGSGTTKFIPSDQIDKLIQKRIKKVKHNELKNIDKIK